MKLTFKIGKQVQETEISDSQVLSVLTANSFGEAPDAESEIKRAITNPVGTPLLKDIVKPGEKIAIISSDITRPMPTWIVMPVLLDELYSYGIRKEDITLTFAIGSHRKHTREEMIHLAGERAFGEIKVRDADSSDIVHIGTTSAGTPVDIDRVVAEADRRICLGNIEFHYFAGYSGGAKAIMPGVSTRNSIQANHSMMIQTQACAGNIDTNPVRLDLEEAARITGVDFIINVVLDSSKQIIKAFAGDMIAAHREGCRFLDSIYKCTIPEKADIVIASQGGYPKDINLYQTQKALDNASHAVKDGGIIILAGACTEGLGEKTFEAWLNEADGPQSLIDRIKREFRLGGHKAASIAIVRQKADIYLVSELPDETAEKAFMTPFRTIDEAVRHAQQVLGENSNVIAMPYGGSTLPCLP